MPINFPIQSSDRFNIGWESQTLLKLVFAWSHFRVGMNKKTSLHFKTTANEFAISQHACALAGSGFVRAAWEKSPCDAGEQVLFAHTLAAPPPPLPEIQFRNWFICEMHLGLRLDGGDASVCKNSRMHKKTSDLFRISGDADSPMYIYAK
jgi:hypothetical protein